MFSPVNLFACVAFFMKSGSPWVRCSIGPASCLHVNQLQQLECFVVELEVMLSCRQSRFMCVVCILCVVNSQIILVAVCVFALLLSRDSVVPVKRFYCASWPLYAILSVLQYFGDVAFEWLHHFLCLNSCCLLSRLSQVDSCHLAFLFADTHFSCQYCSLFYT